MVWPLIAGVALSGAGSFMQGRGAAEAARRRQEAIQRHMKRRNALMDQLAADRYDEGAGRQRSTGRYIDELGGVMRGATAAPTPVAMPDAEVAMPAGTDAAWASAARAGADPMATVQRAQLAQRQTGIDRAQLARAMEALGYQSHVATAAQRAGHERTRFRINQDMLANDAELAQYTDPNSVANMQLFGSMLNAGAQGVMAYGANNPSAGSVQSTNQFGNGVMVR